MIILGYMLFTCFLEWLLMRLHILPREYALMFQTGCMLALVPLLSIYFKLRGEK